MPHVTFVHGISNKPPAEDLLRLWRDAVTDGSTPVPLSDLGVTASIVYWADLLYDAPDSNIAAYEGMLENSADAIDGGGAIPPPIPASTEEAIFLNGLRAKMTVIPDDLLGGDPPPVSASPTGNLERIPLPWFIKKAFLNAYLRDVHHYLFNTSFAPAGRDPVRVQDTIRARFLDALHEGANHQPHVVVSHSLGTVVAYDCLQRVLECPPVDGLITLGSPLGIDEVQDKLRPEFRRGAAYPAKLHGEWHNLFDRLDPVCGFDSKLANDFGGGERLADIAVVNDGTWRHSATKYLRQAAFGQSLRRLLGVGS